MGIKLASCIDCGHKPEEGQLEVRCLHKDIESIRSGRYLKDDEVQQIRADCREKSQELQRVRKVRRWNTMTTHKNTPVYVNLKLEDLIERAEKLNEEATKQPCNLVEKVKKKGLTMTINKNASLRYRNS